MIDFHCHVLPGVDDGSESTEMSLAMLKRMAEYGTKAVIATSHFYPRYESPEDFLHRRDKSAARLRESLTEEHPRVIPAAEVRYFEGMSRSESIPKLAISGTSLILIELPGAPTERMAREIDRLGHLHGLTPILAHVERYFPMLTSRKFYSFIEASGAIPQMNASFLSSRRGAKIAQRWYESGVPFLCGTDSHNLTTRPPNLDRAVTYIEKQLGREVSEDMISFGEELLRQSTAEETH